MAVVVRVLVQSLIGVFADLALTLAAHLIGEAAITSCTTLAAATDANTFERFIAANVVVPGCPLRLAYTGIAILARLTWFRGIRNDFRFINEAPATATRPGQATLFRLATDARTADLTNLCPTNFFVVDWRPGVTADFRTAGKAVVVRVPVAGQIRFVPDQAWTLGTGVADTALTNRTAGAVATDPSLLVSARHISGDHRPSDRIHRCMAVLAVVFGVECAADVLCLPDPTGAGFA